jgi:hypothetical protein
MGKVLSTFDIGWPGAISRSVDDIVVSLKNGGTAAIPFGAPVFLTADGEGVVAYDPNASPAQTFASFVGFAVRVANKTPDTYPAGQDMSSIRNDQSGAWNPKEPVEVLVRGTIAVATSVGFLPGGNVYLRKEDGALVPEAGASGTTILLENVKMRTPQGNNRPCSELLITTRNIQ